MKTRFYQHLVMAVLFSLCASLLVSSCSSFEEEGTGYPLKLQVTVTASAMPENALSSESPFHVVAFMRDKACSPFYYIFEDDAYISNSGQLTWVSKYRYWPGKYTKFIAYWPAESNVVLDDKGNIISADCTLIAISEPYCHFSESPTLKLHPYKN